MGPCCRAEFGAIPALTTLDRLPFTVQTHRLPHTLVPGLSRHLISCVLAGKHEGTMRLSGSFPSRPGFFGQFRASLTSSRFHGVAVRSAAHMGRATGAMRTPRGQGDIAQSVVVHHLRCQADVAFTPSGNSRPWVATSLSQIELKLESLTPSRTTRVLGHTAWIRTRQSSPSR